MLRFLLYILNIVINETLDRKVSYLKKTMEVKVKYSGLITKKKLNVSFMYPPPSFLYFFVGKKLKIRILNVFIYFKIQISYFICIGGDKFLKGVIFYPLN